MKSNKKFSNLNSIEKKINTQTLTSEDNHFGGASEINREREGRKKRQGTRDKGQGTREKREERREKRKYENDNIFFIFI